MARTQTVGYVESAVGKLREMSIGAQLALSYLLSPGPQPIQNGAIHI